MAAHFNLEVQGPAATVASVTTELVSLLAERGDKLKVPDPDLLVEEGRGTWQIAIANENEAEARATLDVLIDQIPDAREVIRPA